MTLYLAVYSWVNSVIVFSLKTPAREQRLITATSRTFPWSLHTIWKWKKKKKDALSLSKSSWLFCLKGAEGSSPSKRCQAAEPGVGDLFVSPVHIAHSHSSQQPGLFYQCTFNGTEGWTATLSTRSCSSYAFFVFNIYLVKMSIGCFYGLWLESHKINPDMTFIYFLQSLPSIPRAGSA